MKRMRIAPNHPIRAKILGLETYHPTKGDALAAIETACAECGIECDHISMSGGEGRFVSALKNKNNAHTICDCCAKKIETEYYENTLVVTWFVLPHGTVELVAYVS